MKSKLSSVVPTVVRLTVEAALCAVIWYHVHWSVAAFITLATIRFECEDFLYARSH